ncbi:MAG: ABC transporter ATP-binding protein [Candidatus Hodarchaeota archaeon]
MDEKNIAIQIVDLEKKFNGFPALNGISFSVEKGDIVGYLGPNGAGKTTTIKILTNLLNPTRGQAYINGINVNRHPKFALKPVGSLVEVPGVYEYFSPHDVLMYFGKVYKMDSKEIRPRIEEVLDLLKIGDWEYKRLGTFSTGMLRRFSIAKALLHYPEILILDEPVLGLDPKGMKHVRELIKRFQNEGMTIFLSSHLLGEVSETCDKVIFLDQGEVVDQDTVENVMQKIESKIIKIKLLNPKIAETMDKIRTISFIEGVDSTNDGILIVFDSTPETSSKILKSLVSLGIDLISFTPVSVSLEDFYLSVMGDEKGVN